MSALVHDSPDRAVTAIEPLTGSDNFATWKRLMTSYLKARQVWDVVSGDLQRPDCLFKYAKPITADIHPLVEPHLNGAVRQRAIEARLEVEVPRRDEPDQCTEVITRPLLGGGAPAERPCATPRTDRGDRLPCGGGSVDPAVPCE
jgi:hypothetical protein